MNEQVSQPLPDILDVAPPVSVPPDPIHWAWWVAGALLALLLIYLFVRFRKKRQAPVESPKEIALRQLERLQGQVAHMDGYQFGVAVSDILRRYLTEAHRLRARQQTSREFLEELERRKAFSEKRQDYLRQFLQTCDFLKYAPAGKAAKPNRELLKQTNFFIREDVV